MHGSLGRIPFLAVIPFDETKLARHLDPETRVLLAAQASRRKLAPGEILFSEGDPGDVVFILLAGRIEILARSVPGRAHRLAWLEPGDYFGEMAVFDGGPRSATARAPEGAEVLQVTGEVLLGVLKRCPSFAIALVRDASLRMRDFNRRFLQGLLKAERLSLVERLARTIVHDFRNPLNVIGIAADLAAEPAISAEGRREARDRIRRQVEVVNRMMQELLDFTRGTSSPRLTPRLPLSAALQDTLLELHSEAQRRGVRLDVAGPVPDVELRLDPPRLQRVFTNLAENAFDELTGRGDGRLQIQFEVSPIEVIIQLMDNGRGIPETVLSQMFEPFVTFGKAHGTGLGLAICDRIVSDHGGHIAVENGPGGGAIFRIHLPRPNPGDTEWVKREAAAP